MIQLTEDNFIFYAMKAYENTSCQDMVEFREDVSRVKYIKRLLNRYIKTGVLKERLLLNHLIVFYNTFSQPEATRMLFFKSDTSSYSALKTFLVFIDRMPERIDGVLDLEILNSDIPVDLKIANVLRKI